jgi:hypothetical protein
MEELVLLHIIWSPYMSQSQKMVSPLSSLLTLYEVVEYVNSYKKE